MRDQEVDWESGRARRAARARLLVVTVLASGVGRTKLRREGGCARSQRAWRAGLERATSGTLCVDARALPRDMPAVIARLRTSDLRVRLVVCSDTDIAHGDVVAEFAAMALRIALLSVPPLSERKKEIPRLLAAYSADAVAELGGTFEASGPVTLDRVLALRADW